MKIDRLLSIVILLMNRPLIQAKELADMFEVSVRTIYRDIDSINGAGIPVVTYQGANGGIGLMEGYRLDRNVLTERELADIFTALQSVSSYGGGEHNLLMEKISSVIPPSKSHAFRSKTTQLIVDFSPWGLQGPLEERLALLKEALEESTAVAFDYVNADGQISHRMVEPYTLVHKGAGWYLYGFCTERQDFRLFKLLRMKSLVKEARSFERLDIPLQDLPWTEGWKEPQNTQTIVLHFSAEGRHLAEDYFDCEELEADGNGGYTVKVAYAENNWLYSFLLSFGTVVEVLEPEPVRRRLAALAAEIAAKYNISTLS
ncbi:helix-turn-helix transcriptional regulator [Paenibacillus jilunlii]|uniref:Transcriptional regulator n=1 Tax=Paenibacillus jilunlii TaxID=682956 RepID=A0A1G9WSR7_9BACL|nr:YafY family protein [Paenibacillus jilunlii]KWX76526.1 transcriptional regulator [Paenibacillus jilunlii]SDM87271.1 Predicted DNA-binding transcriptional regulator YafY, contains an HTH and WYL domains [Paenibacillus jilunlii]